MIKSIFLDLGDTLIIQQIDSDVPLSAMHLTAFHDARHLLVALKRRGYLLALLTNTSQSNERHVYRALKNLTFHKFFDIIITSVDVGFEKPHPAMFLAAMERLKVKPHEVVMVGDDPYKDIFGAQQLGLSTIYVNRDRVLLIDNIKPTFTVHSLNEVLPYLDSIS